MTISQWECLTSGDREAFLSIYESHYQALFSYGFTLTASREQTKDCIQEMFFELWNKRNTVNKEVVNVRSYLFTWLRRKISKDINRVDGEKCTRQLVDNFPDLVLSYEDLLILFQQSEKYQVTVMLL